MVIHIYIYVYIYIYMISYVYMILYYILCQSDPTSGPETPSVHRALIEALSPHDPAMAGEEDMAASFTINPGGWGPCTSVDGV